MVSSQITLLSDGWPTALTTRCRQEGVGWLAEFFQDNGEATVYRDDKDTFALWSARPPRARLGAYPTAREFTLPLTSSCLRPHSYPCLRFAHFPVRASAANVHSCV